MLDLQSFRQTPLETDPYEHVVIRNFVSADALKAAQDSYPAVPGPGSHPPKGLKIERGFKALIEELRGPDFQRAVEEKFGIDLTGRPTMNTVRGFCRARDGGIHTDSRTKIVTVLLYMNNADWPNDGGKLRILRNGDDLENFTAEVEPAGGTLIVFLRSDHSWHGHHSYEGPRRAIQLNWVLDQGVVDREQGRHGLSSFLKKLNPFARHEQGAM